MVSVIITSFNSEKFIENAINSLVNQSFTNWECIIVDDCSSDNTLNIISRVIHDDHRFKVFKLNHNSGGPARPRNIGVSLSSGVFICFLDADDFWSLDKLLVQFDFLNLNQLKYSICSTDRLICHSNFVIEKPLKNHELSFREIDFKDINEQNVLYLSSVMIQSEVIKNFKFNESSTFSFVEDYLLWNEILQVTKSVAAILNYKSLYYRSHDSNFSSDKIMMAKGILRVSYLLKKLNLLYFIFFGIRLLLKWSIRKNAK